MSDKHYSHYISFICSICFLFSLSSCTDSLAQGGTSQRTPTQQAREYWHDGEAEISSYRLNQARYGEIHDGTAVLVFVTEPFSPQHNTKADAYSPNNIPVLKLNTTKKFNTGIYPYSMMTSTFLPFEGESSSLKISSSSQEWCGMSYIEMKNKNKYEFNLNSYFEGETVSDKKIEKEILEEDLWSLIRLNPETLPTGEHHIIPSMFSLRFMHREIKPYKASISISY